MHIQTFWSRLIHVKIVHMQTDYDLILIPFVCVCVTFFLFSINKYDEKIIDQIKIELFILSGKRFEVKCFF